jgi:hypothetical protein
MDIAVHTAAGSAARSLIGSGPDEFAAQSEIA